MTPAGVAGASPPGYDQTMDPEKVTCAACGNVVFADRACLAACPCGEECWVCRRCEAQHGVHGIPLADSLMTEHRIWCINDNGQEGASIVELGGKRLGRDRPGFYRVWAATDDGSDFWEGELPAESHWEALQKAEVILRARARF